MEMERQDGSGFPTTDSPRWHKWYPRIRVFVRYFGGIPASEREDLVQDIFLRALEGRRGFLPGRPFGPWLYTVARRRCLDRVRDGRRKPPPADPELLSFLPGGEDPADLALRNRDFLEIRRFIAGLDRDDRLLVWLRMSEGLGYAAVSRILGAPSGTLKWRMHRIRQELEKHWRRYEQG